MNQKYEVRENEGGVLELYVNGRPCVCPYAGQTVYAVPSSIVGKMDLQVFTKKCDSLCPLFDVINPGSDANYSLSVNCGIGRLLEDIEFIPFEKKSKLSIH